VLSLSGCLQEPADIEGVRNYYIDGAQNNSVNRKQYANKKSNDLEDTYIFDDENPVNTTKSSIFDPYADKDAISTNLKKSDVTFEDDYSTKQLDNNNLKIKSNSEVDWDNIFNDKAKSDIKHIDKSVVKNAVGQEKIITSTLKQNQKTIVNISKVQTKKNENSNIQSSNEKPKINNQISKSNSENKLCCIRKPTQGAILSRYGKSNDNELDDGMTFKVTDKNIISSGDGKVIYTDGQDNNAPTRKTIIVKHTNGLIVSYSYNGTLKTGLNREVKAGQIIGSVNDDKNVLYFTARNNGKAINPESIMR
jgi:murein DD-endopeptidase MepM/ murein hydrolase activator NlpD